MEEPNFAIDHVSETSISLTIHVDRVNILQSTFLVQIHLFSLPLSKKKEKKENCATLIIGSDTSTLASIVA